MQLVVETTSQRVSCVAVGRGQTHDLKLLRASQTHFAATTLVKADQGDPGINHDHVNSQTSDKKPPRRALGIEQRQANRRLASARIAVEQGIRRFKIFRVLRERYRNRQRRFGLRVQLIAAIYNRDAPL